MIIVFITLLGVALAHSKADVSQSIGETNVCDRNSLEGLAGKLCGDESTYKSCHQTLAQFAEDPADEGFGDCVELVKQRCGRVTGATYKRCVDINNVVCEQQARCSRQEREAPLEQEQPEGLPACRGSIADCTKHAEEVCVGEFEDERFRRDCVAVTIQLCAENNHPKFGGKNYCTESS